MRICLNTSTWECVLYVTYKNIPKIMGMCARPSRQSRRTNLSRKLMLFSESIVCMISILEENIKAKLNRTEVEVRDSNIESLYVANSDSWIIHLSLQSLQYWWQTLSMTKFLSNNINMERKISYKTKNVLLSAKYITSFIIARSICKIIT